MNELEKRVNRQVSHLIGIGAHKHVYDDLSTNLARVKYRGDFSLPEGAVQPPLYKGRFGKLIVVDPRIKLSFGRVDQYQYCEYMNSDTLEKDEFVDLVETPARAYAIWTYSHWGHYLKNPSSNYVDMSDLERLLESLPDDEIALNGCELVANSLQDLHSFESKRGYSGFIVPGNTRLIGDHNIVIGISSSLLPTLEVRHLDSAGFYIKTRGKEIIKLGN